MKGLLVQTTIHSKESLKKIIETGIIGKNSNALLSQPPLFKDQPLIFSSYFCKGYPKTYGNNYAGIIFETDSPVVYACPADSFTFLRSAHWLPGYERFIFSSIEDMLKKYPTSTQFQHDFQEYFKNLNPQEVYPDHSLEFAELHHRMDYCLTENWVSGCNEITFKKPIRVKNCKIFSSQEELDPLLKTFTH